MQRFNLGGQRLIALALLGAVLLTPPLLNSQAGEGGESAFLHLFGVWGLLIGVAAWVAERKG